MPNKTTVFTKTLFLLAFFALVKTQAATSVAECQAALGKARSSLVDMLAGKINDEQQKLVKDTANETQDCMDKLEVKGKEVDVKELKKTWTDFKFTREKDLVPAILAGKKDEAKAIATGIQKERLDKMQMLIKKLKGGDL